MRLVGSPYGVRIKSLVESRCDVVFEVHPAIDFISEEARIDFGRHVLHLVNRRADERDKVLQNGECAITHNLPDKSASVGYAKIESLRYGSGREVFVQALLMALNGEVPNLYENNVAPWEEVAGD